MKNVKITTPEEVLEAFNNLTPWDQLKIRETIISAEDIEEVIKLKPESYINLIADDDILEYVRDNFDAEDLVMANLCWI